MKLFTHSLFVLSAILFVFIFTSQAHAMTTRSGQAVYVPKDEVIIGTLVAGGNTVAIDGTVHGDVLCGSQSVVITGTVDGDVICGAQSIRITGTVGGSVRSAAQTIEIAGPVKRNVTVVGQTITLASMSTVSGEVVLAAQQFTDNGSVAGSITGVMDHGFIDAKVGGDIHVNTSGLTFGANAKVAGSVWYQSKSVATLAPSASIAGTLIQTLPKANPQSAPVSQIRKVAGGGNNLLGKIIFYILLAFIVTKVAPKRTKRILDIMQSSPGPMMLAGFVTVIVVPVVIITMVITLIGIPFAVLLGLVFALAIAVAEVYASVYTGRYLLVRFNMNRDGRMSLNILVGVPVLVLLYAIPFIGGLASFVGLIWGLGAMVETRKSTGKAK